MIYDKIDSVPFLEFHTGLKNCIKAQAFHCFKPSSITCVLSPKILDSKFANDCVSFREFSINEAVNFLKIHGITKGRDQVILEMSSAIIPEIIPNSIISFIGAKFTQIPGVLIATVKPAKRRPELVGENGNLNSGDCRQLDDFGNCLYKFHPAQNCYWVRQVLIVYLLPLQQPRRVGDVLVICSCTSVVHEEGFNRWGVRFDKIALKAVREYTRAIDKLVNDIIHDRWITLNQKKQ